MNFEISCEALESTFKELAHLLVIPDRLTLDNAELGVGGFGVVGLATLDKSSTSPRKVAVKQLQIMETSVVKRRVAFRLARELKIWAKVKHPNVLELIGYYLSDNYGCAQFVSAYMVNGNVMQYIQRTRAGLAVRLKFVQDIAAGLEYLHDFSPPICHGDLKPANVLVNEVLDAVLCDFGVSSFIQESEAASGLTTSKSIQGSTRYMSPELFSEEEHSKHTLESDVWAWGCTAFEVMTEIIPYPNKSKDFAVIIEMQKKSIPGSIEALGDLLVGANVDPACQTGVTSLQSIIMQCWNFDPMQRPSSTSILQDVTTHFETKAYWWDQEDGGAGISPPHFGASHELPDSKYCGNDSHLPNSRYVFWNPPKSQDASQKSSSFGDFRDGGQRPPFPGGSPWGMPYQNTGYGGQGYPYQNNDYGGQGGYSPNWQQQQQWQQGGYGQHQQPPEAPAPQAPPSPPPGKPCEAMNCNGTEFAPGSKYCSTKCSKAAVKCGFEVACLMCKDLPKTPKGHFCGKSCSEKAEENAPILLNVPENNPKFDDIVKQFHDTWQGSNKPTVHRVCKVVNSTAAEDRFEAYREKVEQTGNWVSRGKTAGNAKGRWHGTVRECTIGDDPNQLDMCTSTKCKLCCSILLNFDIKYVPAGVYGLGIYTSVFSSTSHRYTSVSAKGSPYRAIFLTEVVAGKEHIFTLGITDANATAPPAGYDSVAMCRKHSELIVFQKEAIRPSWLILYS